MRKVRPLVPKRQNYEGSGGESGRLEGRRCQGQDEATQRGFMENRKGKKNSIRNRGKSWTGMLR